MRINLYDYVEKERKDLLEEWCGEKEEMKSIFKGAGDKVLWKCSKDSHHKWEARISSRTGKNSTGCPICANKIICEIDYCNSLYELRPELRAEWCKENGNMKNFFEGSHDKVLWKCSKDSHHKWEARIYNRTGKNPRGCPTCNQSKLEKAMESLLQKLNLEYKKEHKFDDCRGKNNKHFRFDFYLSSQNLCIELHGIQHYEYHPFFHRTEENYLYRKECDEYKENYCMENNINLLTISYEQIDDIESLLQDKLLSIPL